MERTCHRSSPREVWELKAEKDLALPRDEGKPFQAKGMAEAWAEELLVCLLTTSGSLPPRHMENGNFLFLHQMGPCD